jgi:mono/diheme cytochrome c family protein
MSLSGVRNPLVARERGARPCHGRGALRALQKIRPRHQHRAPVQLLHRLRLRVVAVGAALAVLLAGGVGRAEEAFTPQQVDLGRTVYAQNCAHCHGSRMQDPESAYDLRKFPHDERARFVTSVTRGKNQMPPWGDLLTSEEITALWGYVTTGEKN